MSLRIQNNVEAFNAHRNLQRDLRQDRASRWSVSPAATASTARPTTPPASRSARRMRWSDQRSRPGSAQHPGRRLAGADGGRASSTRSTRCSSASASWPCSTRTARSAATTRPRSSPRSTSSRRRSSASAARAEFNGITPAAPAPARSRSRSAPTTVRLDHRGHDLAWAARCRPTTSTCRTGTRHRGDRHGDQHRVRRRARRSARSRTASSTRWRARAVYQENLTASESRDPRRGHGCGDGQVHQEPDPAAGRHVDARSGQPGPAERPLAAPLAAPQRNSSEPPQASGGPKGPPVVVRRTDVQPPQPRRAATDYHACKRRTAPRMEPGTTHTSSRRRRMSLRIQNNVEAFDAHRNLNATSDKLASRWSVCRRATASTVRPTTRPAWPSPRSCASQISGLAQAQPQRPGRRLDGADG